MKVRSYRSAVLGAIGFSLAGASSTGYPQQTARCRITGSPTSLPSVREASGAALGRRAPGVVWTHDDSGEPVIVALDTTGALRARIWVAGAQVVDWEDVGIGPCPTGSCLYIADIGDNTAKRREIVVYRVTEPGLQDRSTRDAEAFRARYPAGAQDAEAVFVAADGRLFVVTKGETGAVALYRYPMPLRTGVAVRLEKVATFSAKKVPRARWITGAATSPDGKWIVLRTPASLGFYRADRLTQGNAANPIVFDIRGAREVQGEGVALANDGTVYLVGEGGGKGRPGTFVRLSCRVGTDREQRTGTREREKGRGMQIGLPPFNFPFPFPSLLSLTLFPPF